MAEKPKVLAYFRNMTTSTEQQTSEKTAFGVTYFYLARRFKTPGRAKAVFKQLSAAPDHDLTLFNFFDHLGEPAVAVISEQKGEAEAYVAQLTGPPGEAFELSEDHAAKMILRRIRLIDMGRRKGTRQSFSYENGAWLNGLGYTVPRTGGG